MVLCATQILLFVRKLDFTAKGTANKENRQNSDSNDSAVAVAVKTVVREGRLSILYNYLIIDTWC